MDGKDLISSPSSDLQSFYGQQHLTHSPSSHHLAAGMHSVIRPMPNMNILNSIGLAGMQFHMDPPLLHNNNNMGSASGVSGPPAPRTEPPPVKRKRGRPRKYGPDGTMKASATAAAQQQHQMVSAPPRMEMLGNSPLEDHQAQKKKRGRPPGTGKKQHVSSPSAGNAFPGTAGTSFTPHIITASPSEDVAAKIVAFANQSAKAVCVLSAMGSVSRVVLRHPADGSSPMSRVHASAPYKNPAIYEGFYEILSLSGSYSMSEGQQQSGGLSVTLCSPERNVIGGVLGGPLVAATTVQVVLGSFHQRSKSKKAGKQQAAFSPGSLTGGQEASPSSGHNQNLTPPGWPSSGIFDNTSPNIDINSSRG